MTPHNENAPDAGQGLEGMRTDPHQGADPMPFSHNPPNRRRHLRVVVEQKAPTVYREVRLVGVDQHDTSGLVSVYFDGGDWLVWAPAVLQNRDEVTETSADRTTVVMFSFSPANFDRLASMFAATRQDWEGLTA